jgi:hypothetical protein
MDFNGESSMVTELLPNKWLQRIDEDAGRSSVTFAGSSKSDVVCEAHTKIIKLAWLWRVRPTLDGFKYVYVVNP